MVVDSDPEPNLKVIFGSSGDQHAESSNSVLPRSLIPPQPPVVNTSTNSPESVIVKSNPLSRAHIPAALASDNTTSYNGLEAETVVETQPG